MFWVGTNNNQAIIFILNMLINFKTFVKFTALFKRPSMWDHEHWLQIHVQYKMLATHRYKTHEILRMRTCANLPWYNVWPIPRYDL